MKYIAALLVAGGVYVMLTRHAPVSASAPAQADNATPGTDFLKAPLDRTHEVLNQERTRVQEPGSP